MIPPRWVLFKIPRYANSEKCRPEKFLSFRQRVYDYEHDVLTQCRYRHHQELKSRSKQWCKQSTICRSSKDVLIDQLPAQCFIVTIERLSNAKVNFHFSHRLICMWYGCIYFVIIHSVFSYSLQHDYSNDC